ncbi:hypothetical protein ACQPYE_21535 [Actinosynnema sp. CA-299493]
MPFTRFIRVTTSFEGLHHWTDAPGPEGYLRASHRHLFTVEADVEVFHDDREIEINAATRWLADLMPGFAERPVAPGDLAIADFGGLSCEQLALLAAEAILERYGRDRSLRCAVLEDAILGAGVVWAPDPPR